MAGKNDLFLTLSKTCGRVSSQQGAPTTCNLTYGKASQQTFVRTLMASLGVVVGQYWDVQWGREEMRLDNGCGGRAQFTRSVGGGGGGGFGKQSYFRGDCQHSYSRRQIPSDTPNCVFPKNSFLPRTFHYFHIPQPAKNCQKNRYFE